MLATSIAAAVWPANRSPPAAAVPRPRRGTARRFFQSLSAPNAGAIYVAHDFHCLCGSRKRGKLVGIWIRKTGVEPFSCVLGGHADAARDGAGKGKESLVERSEAQVPVPACSDDSGRRWI